MYSVGSGMVLAIGDLAGATFVTLLAATARQFARAGRLWTLCTIEIEVAVRLGWSGMALAIDGRADVQKGRDVLRQSCGLRDAGRDGVRDAAAGGFRDPSIALTGYPA